MSCRQKVKESNYDKAAMEILERNIGNICRRGSVTSNFLTGGDTQMLRQLHSRNLSLPNIHFPNEHINQNYAQKVNQPNQEVGARQ